MDKRLCEVCEKKMEKSPHYSYKQWSNRRFCSHSCVAKWRVVQGISVFKKGHSHSESTKRKIGESHRGNKSVNWKGGRVSDGHGYIKVMENGKYRLEHRMIIEKHIGRKLDKLEHVHHINGIKDDNRLANLIVLSKSDHHSLHSKRPRR